EEVPPPERGSGHAAYRAGRCATFDDEELPSGLSLRRQHSASIDHYPGTKLAQRSHFSLGAAGKERRVRNKFVIGTAQQWHWLPLGIFGTQAIISNDVFADVSSMLHLRKDPTPPPRDLECDPAHDRHLVGREVVIDGSVGR